MRRQGTNTFRIGKIKAGTVIGRFGFTPFVDSRAPLGKGKAYLDVKLLLLLLLFMLILLHGASLLCEYSTTYNF